MTISSPPPLVHPSPLKATAILAGSSSLTNDSSTADHKEDQYLEAVKRMHARQDAWSRAARSASASASASDSPSGSRSRSPSKARDGLHMSSSTSAAGQADSRAGPSSGQAQKKGRKKVAKACLACQKSHVTCDDKRPCTRCVKKGIGQQCVEGVRKKAKYLLEEDEKKVLDASQSSSQRHSSHPIHPSVSPVLHQHQVSPTHTHHSFSQPPPNPPPNPVMETDAMPTSNLPPSLQPNPGQRQTGMPDDIWLAPPLEGENGIGLSGVGDGRLWFGSGGMTMADNTGTNTPFNVNGMTAATSEYAMLDSMFAMDPVFPGLSGLDGMDQHMQVDQQFVNPNWTGQRTSTPPRPQTGGTTTAHNQHIGPASQSSYSTSLPNPALQHHANIPTATDNAVLTAPPNFDLPNSPWSTWLNNQTQGGAPDGGSNEAATTAAGLLASGGGKKTMSSSEVYKTVTKPYDYTEGYHTLMQYLTTNFERKEILRVVHSLASYRPSLIALQMPMSEEDEVFLEKSFQRTLIELEKLISYSATPTAVWRRTGEVCYANPEFCSLVRRNETDLFGKKNYIYQLFSKPSVIAYWENFSVHAFENTTQNFFQPTSLTLVNGNIDCSCCFTIRRDVFDLPSVIIGQFLPIPQEG